MAGKKILRDSWGRVLPGTAPLNPAGRPPKKRDILDKIMKNFYGPDCEQLLLNMIEIAEYDSKVDFKNTPSKEKRFFKPKFNSTQIMEARKFLFIHYYGAPITENITEIKTAEDTQIKVKFIKSKKNIK